MMMGEELEMDVNISSNGYSWAMAPFCILTPESSPRQPIYIAV